MDLMFDELETSFDVEEAMDIDVEEAIDIDIDDFKFDLSQRQITRLKGEKITNKLLSGNGFISENEFNFIQDKLHKLESNKGQDSILMVDDEDETESIKSLPIHLKSDDGTDHISIETLNELINNTGKYKDLFDHFMIIDCRYKYEYNGGHINGSLNIQSSNLLQLLFKINFSSYSNNKRIAWIFHCEYSQKRGPRAAGFVRNLDRTINSFNYPNLFLPHLYVLHGGYKKYFETNNIGTYVSMFDENFNRELVESEVLDRKSWPTQKGKNVKSARKKQFRTQVLCLMFVSKLKKQTALNKSLLLT